MDIFSLIDQLPINKVFTDEQEFMNALISYNDKWKVYKYLCDTLGVDEIFNIFGNDNIVKLFQDKYGYRFMVSLFKKDLHAFFNNLFADYRLLNSFIENWHNFYSETVTFDYDIVNSLIEYAFKNNLENNIQYYFNNDVNVKLLESNLDDNIKILIINNAFDENIIEQYLGTDLVLNNLDLIGDYVLFGENRKLPDNLLHSKQFFDKITSNNSVGFRYHVNMVLNSNPSYDLYSKIKTHEDRLINLVNSNKIFNDLDFILTTDDCFEAISGLKHKLHIDKELLVSKWGLIPRNNDGTVSYDDKLFFLQKYTNYILSELIVDYLFEDNIYNVWLNIKEIMSYYEKRPIISKEHFQFYQYILDIDNMSIENKLKLYNTFKDMNVNLLFYEDIKKMKLDSYQHINEDIIKLDDIKSKKNKILSFKYHTDVIDLRGSKFKMLVRVMSGFYSTNCNNQDCYSLIGDENTNVVDGNIVYGYDNVDPEKIVNVYESDSFSSSNISNISSCTPYVNRIMTSDEIITNDYCHSEINVMNSEISFGKYEVLKPSYIVCFDEVDEASIRESKNTSLPIVLVKHNHMNIDNSNIKRSFLNKDYKYIYESISSRENNRRKF